MILNNSSVKISTVYCENDVYFNSKTEYEVEN